MSHRKTMIKVKRVYDPVEPGDGVRILVDRLWPRGIARDDVRIHRWLPEVAPSTELRRWFGHRAEAWTEFQRRYFAELDANPSLPETLRDGAEHGAITLLFAAKERQRNNAVALRRYLERTA